MSQSREKLRRRVDKLEAKMSDLQQATIVDGNRFAACMYSIRDLAEQDNAAIRRRSREKARLAREWRLVAWLSLVAFVLCAAAALCLTIHVRASAEQPGEVIPVTETQEDFENEKIEAALLEKANVIDDCTVTWYTADTCGKQPGDPAYGITYSGEPVVEHLTCAVDPDVIPLYSDVFVQYTDGTIKQLWATDTGVTGNAIDIYTPDYDYAIQCGKQELTVWWVGPEGDES